MPQLCELTARETARRVANGDLAVETLTRSHLEHIAEVDPAIEAWQHLDPDRAIAAARALDRSGAGGPLKGVLVGVKDVIDTVDMPTTYGSDAYSGHQPAYDATVVAELRHAGGLLLGKTVSTEFALMAAGKTKNPFNAAHTPGGRRGWSQDGAGGPRHPDRRLDHSPGRLLRRGGLQADL
jgi:amidase